MRFILKPLLLLIVFFLYQCNAAPEQKTSANKEKVIDVKKQEEKKIEKSWDSLNRFNAEAFLTAYGKENPETKVVIKTKFGDIKLRLYEDVPVHRANFIFLTKIKYFNTTVIYRVAKNFVIQGGNSDNLYTQKQRRKYGNYLLEPEFRKNRKHKYGALAAARQWENNPNKLSSPFEFYMVHKRNGAHHLDNEHTVFGEVVSGFDTLDKISKVKVGVDEWPVNDIPMTIEILD
ncbi:peptidylprolyl isomerase [Polaribacter dokdonensis]|uniref:Peptidyl-prolyl cis-trans isomerase n=1 Tax=Polaribacter dokdonensis DSW-5 TaxID=1300348 RepID=A0A0N0CG78_9FLAO|nr:peptidylprolyl isomerase [Polaribacter dokdonensis]KOY52954.1 Cyclophilin type peptidyl-prolyl cis-trans isomerase/CLD [Polaribacter dokdonensis DSW-5]SEE54979.1 peptidylprolyl isomerase [Polaribacter dokdonensis DSW-5]